MEVGTTEISSAITTARKHGGWNNWEFICNNKYKKTWREFSTVPTSMFSCICYCRRILSCSNLHVFLYLLVQMNLSCSNLHVFLYLLLQVNSQLLQPPCFLVVVIADEISVVPTSMFFCICYCRWILSCSNLHVFLYLLLQIWNSWEFICNNKYKKTWSLEQLRIHLQ